MKIELFALVILPGEAFVKLEQPVDKQADRAPQANLGQTPEQAEEAARTGRRLRVVVNLVAVIIVDDRGFAF